MSKIGKRILIVPQGTTLEIKPREITVKGPKGEITKKLALDGFVIKQQGSTVKIIPPSLLNKRNRSLWGTFNSILAGMIAGVNTVFEKALEFNGIGYRVEVSGTDVVLHVGFSHPVKLAIPAGCAVSVNKNQIIVSGVDKEHIGLFAAQIRKVRKVEPYKGTGIKYVNEIVKKKAGKKLVGAAAVS